MPFQKVIIRYGADSISAVQIKKQAELYFQVAFKQYLE